MYKWPFHTGSGISPYEIFHFQCETAIYTQFCTTKQTGLLIIKAQSQGTSYDWEDNEAMNSLTAITKPFSATIRFSQEWKKSETSIYYFTTFSFCLTVPFFGGNSGSQSVEGHPHKEPFGTAVSRLFTGQMPFLSPNQQCQSTEGMSQNRRKTKMCHFQTLCPTGIFLHGHTGPHTESLRIVEAGFVTGQLPFLTQATKPTMLKHCWHIQNAIPNSISFNSLCPQSIIHLFFFSALFQFILLLFSAMFLGLFVATFCKYLLQIYICWSVMHGITYLIYKILCHLPKNVWCNFWDSVRIFTNEPQYAGTSHRHSDGVCQLGHVAYNFIVCRRLNVQHVHTA